MPSSTMSAVFPAISRGFLPARYTLPAPPRLPFLCLDLPREPCAVDYCRFRIVQEHRPIRVYRSDRVLGIIRSPYLAHRDDVERERKRTGDFVPRHDAAARECQNDRILSAIGREPFCELTSGIVPIFEHTPTDNASTAAFVFQVIVLALPLGVSLHFPRRARLYSCGFFFRTGSVIAFFALPSRRGGRVRRSVCRNSLFVSFGFCPRICVVPSAGGCAHRHSLAMSHLSFSTAPSVSRMSANCASPPRNGMMPTST